MSNLDKLRHAYQQWHETRGASVAAWLDLMADDVVLRSLADGAAGMEFSKARSGRSQAEDYFAGIARDWEMVYDHAEEFIAEGDRVVMLGRYAWRYRPTGRTAEPVPP